MPCTNKKEYENCHERFSSPCRQGPNKFKKCPPKLLGLKDLIMVTHDTTPSIFKVPKNYPYLQKHPRDAFSCVDNIFSEFFGFNIEGF